MFVHEGTLYEDKDNTSWTGDHVLRMSNIPKQG